jgi:hypothetical protein
MNDAFPPKIRFRSANTGTTAVGASLPLPPTPQTTAFPPQADFELRIRTPENWDVCEKWGCDSGTGNRIQSNREDAPRHRRCYGQSKLYNYFN